MAVVHAQRLNQFQAQVILEDLIQETLVDYAHVFRRLVKLYPKRAPLWYNKKFRWSVKDMKSHWAYNHACVDDGECTVILDKSFARGKHPRWFAKSILYHELLHCFFDDHGKEFSHYERLYMLPSYERYREYFDLW